MLSHNIHLLVLASGVIILCLLFFVSLIYKRGILDSAPAILTSVGIFFTFVGITLALFDFNAGDGDITTGFNQLLDSLKIAFIPSALGVFLSIITKIITAKNTDVDLGNKVNINLEHIATILAQNHIDMTLVMQKFKTELIEENTTLLTNSLQIIFDDFNVKISDHLGENFKELANSTTNLVTWQDEYKQFMSQFRDNFTQIAHESTQLITQNTNQTAQFTELLSIIERCKHEVSNIGSSIISTHTKLSNDAGNISASIEGLDNLLEQKLTLMNKHLVKVDDVLNNFNNNSDVMLKNISQMVAANTESVKNVLKQQKTF